MSSLQHGRYGGPKSFLFSLKNNKALIVSLCLLLLASVTFAKINHVPLDTDGGEVTNFMDEKGEHFYKVKISQNYDGKQDLVINIKGVKARSDPDLLVSSTNEAPMNRSESEYSCVMVGEDICTIPASDISPGKTFYVTAKCYRQCEYKINASLLSETEIMGRKDYTFAAKAESKRIFTFTNPHPGVQALYFTARADRESAGMRMYLKEGTEGTPSSNDIHSAEGWENGIVIKITQNTPVKVKEDQTYKLLFETDDDVIVTVRVDLTYDEKLIEEGEVYEDFVYFNEKSCYKYNIRSSDRKFRVGVYSFSGNPDIYVNPESIPENLEDFAFIANEPSDDVLVLTPEDRSKAGAKKGAYFICVIGHSNTSFRLRVVESDKDYFLEDGIAETNEVHSGSEAMFYYTDEALVRDLDLTFTMSVKSGPHPKMYVKFCGRVPEEQCLISSNPGSDVSIGTAIGGKSVATLPHVGNRCEKKVDDQHLPCIYAIEVRAASTWFDSVTHFSIVAQHNETSHLRLREGISVEQVVENHQVRYFMFIVRDAATSVTFTLNSHHGDADIYVSRKDKYPSEQDFEFKSARSNRFADEVVYNNERDGNLAGVYYIAVKGFEYSSYSLRATIQRSGDEGDIVPLQLTEGVQQNEFLRSGAQKKYFQFKTRMYGEYISDIKISVTPVVGEFEYYVKAGSIPTETDYDYKSSDGRDIIMRKTDKKFDPVGMKYILVKPVNRYGSEFSNDLRFTIKYTTTSTVNTLAKDVPSFGTVQMKQYNYYTFTNIEKDNELTISLTAISGDPNLVVSLDPALESPTRSENTYHSMKEGKDSIVISGSKMADLNPSCSPHEGTLLGAPACQIFIGVYCNDVNQTPETRENDSCSYSLKVYSEFGKPHMLMDGLPQKDQVKQSQKLFYYMPVNAGNDYMYIAATADVGDVKLYVTFADQSSKDDELATADDKEHIKKGKRVSHSEMIHFSRKELSTNCEEYGAECMAVITVEGTGAVLYNEFTLIAYTRIPRLSVDTPAVAQVDDDSMTYFSFKSYCEDCTLIISASAYAVDADIDMFINVGHKKELPTKDAHDIKSTEWFSEHIMLDSQHDFMKKNKIKSMQETFIIGIYAKEATTVAVEVEEASHGIKKLGNNKGVLVDQEPNDHMYFKYEHKGNSNIKFEITGLKGRITMRINCYEAHENDQPEHKFLPHDSRTAKWEKDSFEEPFIVIEEEDDLFCEGGVYLVGVQSDINGAKYTIEAQREDAFTTKHIKLGVPIKDSITKNNQKQYMFVLDRKKHFRISVSVFLGKVSYEIGNTPDFKKPLIRSESESLVFDEKDLKKFEEGDNVYIRVKGDFDKSEFILLVSHNDSYSILPDSYTQEFSVDPYDADGVLLMYYPPSDEHQLKVQINSLHDGMAYNLNVEKAYVDDIKEGELVFPIRTNWGDFGTGYRWEPMLRHSVTLFNMQAERNDDYVLLMRIKPHVSSAQDIEGLDQVKFSINANAHSMIVMSPNIPFEENISPSLDNYKFFKFFASGERDLSLILMPCMCMFDMYVYRTYEDAMSSRNVVYRTSQMINGEKVISIANAKGPYFLKVQLSPENEYENLRKGSYCAFQVVYVDKAHPNYKYSVQQYTPANDGRVEFEWPEYNKLVLSWGKILEEGLMRTTEHDTIATVYAMRNRGFFVNSMCGVKHAIIQENALATWNGVMSNSLEINMKDNKKIPEEDYATFYVMASVNREGGKIAYQPLTLMVRASWYQGIPWWMYAAVIVLVLVLGAAAFFYKTKAEDTQSKLDFEMNDIRNVARVGYSDDEVERANLAAGQA